MPNKIKPFIEFGLLLPHDSEINDSPEASFIVNFVWILGKSCGVGIDQRKVIESIQFMDFSHPRNRLLNVVARLIFISGKLFSGF